MLSCGYRYRYKFRKVGLDYQTAESTLAVIFITLSGLPILTVAFRASILEMEIADLRPDLYTVVLRL